jgi:hypothetical protein
MAMRWYQHNVHGVNLATSEKYRLPTVARVATIHAPRTALVWIARAIEA